MGFPCAEGLDTVWLEGVGGTGVAGTLEVVEVVEVVEKILDGTVGCLLKLLF